mmetsp:Transcript_29810/g.54118  ORF Transcript_29810/g.54118 Transcript_29810/m.54118 type:complete len:376 (+) Transcript_29810:106-1233(+)
MVALLTSSVRKCPETVVKRTERSTRIVVVALAFVTSYLLFDRFHPDLVLDIMHNSNGAVRYTSSTSSFNNSSSVIMDENNIPITKIRIFYNLFTKSPEEEERVRKIVEEQFDHIDPMIHDTNVSITSIGHKLSSLPNNSFIKEHYKEGGEDLTLHAIWQYCKKATNNNHHNDVKVIYLHSKGSYHPNESNHRLRNFVTQGALSTECANLPESCNVCSSRMSPLPHPHTSGNMWLARCDYIARLFDPLSSKEGKLPQKVKEDNPCKGRGRYLGEHWVHSHPSVMPCDLYPGKEFTWAHLRVPLTLTKELRRAPRFTFDEYVLSGMCLSQYPETLSSRDFVRLRKQNYEMLYNITDLDEVWWGWEFLQRSILLAEMS